MSKVFVLDTNKQPLNPVHPGRARLLLKQGKAGVYRRYPFTIRLSRAVEQPNLYPLHIKIDPGSKTTGIALINDASGDVVWAAELTHRGEQIKRNLDRRRAVRRKRRQCKSRYRKPRFNITTAHGVVTDIHHRFCVLVARSDGYTYQQGKEAAFPLSA
jgi:hypothetical protein